MESKQAVLLLTSEAATADAVSAALGPTGGYQTNGTFSTLASLAMRLGQSPVPVALVDIDPDPPRALAELGPIAARFEQTRFVVLSRDASSQTILQAMSAGARHYLLKETIAAQLLGVLGRLAPAPLVQQAMGSMFTVLGASGGCGATTLAVSLADLLHRLEDRPSLLVDFDLVYGGAGAYLGLAGPFSLADVAAKSGRIDPELVRSTALSYAQGLSVLISPATSNFFDPPKVNHDNLRAVLDACRQAGEFVVADAPRMSLELAATLAAQSLATLVVFQLNVKDVRTAQNMILALGERGVEASRLVAVVNRYQNRNAMVRLEDAQKALRGLKLWLIRNDFSSAIRCLNYGQPVAQSAPRSALYHDLRELARHLLERHRSQPNAKGA